MDYFFDGIGVYDDHDDDDDDDDGNEDDNDNDDDLDDDYSTEKLFIVESNIINSYLL